ncbi:MAG: hypothetical protein A4E52_00786 [Pelotomaculum sp. PtaB.Bin013]|uniref:Uncharacterized protein n=1 Tax=Pelotomaculum isophthalicicum JI TaxID=947010 RepID=A0A9X4JUS0_9FIRM|nr:hypothetical protein [Pelotomaculum isophthalicicum]MDF9409745.1 hypothetical protein [Pelotomaculum isophthalicicum JI]OPX90582.1 MAG: hypothetical protein A4E52_00786 [Pelotomaculum sp. PtaB.Bin013]
MKRYWTIRLSLLLFFLSLSLYFIHYLIFSDAYYIIKHLIGDLAFLPIEVLLVTIILHRLLDEREKRIMLKKLNMVIGAFFSEVGNRLLKVFTEFDSHSQELVRKLIIDNNWSNKDFNNAGVYIKNHNYNIKIHCGNLEYLHVYLIEKRGFLLRLLENPNLLEHESFSELLWAVFHLTEELIVRQNLRQLSSADTEHLSNDMKRAYIFLITEWLQYMKHLSKDYPYLFSLAIRTNPYDPNATPEIK